MSGRDPDTPSFYHGGRDTAPRWLQVSGPFREWFRPGVKVQKTHAWAHAHTPDVAVDKPRSWWKGPGSTRALRQGEMMAGKSGPVWGLSRKEARSRNHLEAGRGSQGAEAEQGWGGIPGDDMWVQSTCGETGSLPKG